ncbi:MAG TPA: hypothetical protein VMV83_01105 [Rectinemataceae bacterium]|nr:hypothetical protein [Rectinemataceae bacterium]
MSGTSIAAQVLIALIPIVGIVLGSVVVFFWLLWNHRERKLLIQQGAWTPSRFDVETVSLLSGLLLSAVGIVLTILILIVDGIGYPLLGGLVPLSAGVGLLIFVRFRAAARR